jgi:hypothetical protein
VTGTTAASHRVLGSASTVPDRGPDTWIPYSVDVDGDRALLVEYHERDDRVRAYVLDGGLGPVAWTSRTFAPSAIAGEDAFAAATRPRRIAVADLATGAERASAEVAVSDARGIDITAGGRIVAQTARGLATVSPGGPADDDGVPSLLGEDESRRALGPPAGVFTDIAADDRGVAWLANGCVRYATIAGPVPVQAGADPCPVGCRAASRSRSAANRGSRSA